MRAEMCLTEENVIHMADKKKRTASVGSACCLERLKASEHCTRHLCLRFLSLYKSPLCLRTLPLCKSLLCPRMLPLYIGLLCLLCPIQVCAAEEEIAEEAYSAFQLEDIEDELKELFPNTTVSLKEIFTSILTGETEATFDFFIDSLWHAFAGELSEFKSVIIMIVSIGLVSALFTNFMDIFENHQIADISFYFAYLLLMTLLLRVFAASVEVAYTALEKLLIFMKLLIPTYFMAVGAAAGTTTALVFYRLMLVLLYGIEHILSAALFPFIYGYAFLSIVNGLWVEERLSGILELIQKGIAYALKTALTVVSGISILQAMITPVIDSVKVAAFQKAISVIPGIGGFANGVTEMVIGSAVLIKNSIGVLLVILLLLLCLAPLMKLFIVSVLLKGSAALIGVVCDKRMTGCIDRIGDSTFMLLRTVAASIILFIITVAIIICTTNHGI